MPTATADIPASIEPDESYRRGWDRAFAKLAAERSVEAAARRQIEAAAERGAANAAAEREDLMTIPGVAKRLAVTDRTVRNLIADEKLVTVKIPGTTSRRVEPRRVDALIAEGREGK